MFLFLITFHEKLTVLFDVEKKILPDIFARA